MIGGDGETGRGKRESGLGGAGLTCQTCPDSPILLPVYGLDLVRSRQSGHTGQVRGGPLGGWFCVRTVRPDI